MRPAGGANLATLRIFCPLNLLRRNQQYKVGVRAKQKAAGWSPRYLMSLLKFQIHSPWAMWFWLQGAWGCCK